MELQIIKLSLERVLDKLNIMEKQNRKLKKRVKYLEQNQNEVLKDSKSEEKEDTLIDTKEVLQILGICYNTLQKIIKKGLIHPIRISVKRMRFSKNEILNYVNSQSS